jgi:hypothetical protein
LNNYSFILESKKIKIFLTIILLVVTTCLNAARPQKLRFRTDSTFKIVQFTDLHIVWQDGRSDSAYKCMDQVIRTEKPDFIMLTGDIVFSNPAVDNFRKIINFISSYKTPFGFVFGNHDHQFSATDSVLLCSVKDIPYNMTTTAVGIAGDSNYALPVYSSDGKKVESVIYGLDSHNDSRFGKKLGIKGYDHIYYDQIGWYMNTSKQYAKMNNGTPLPSLMFFHIPIPEYMEAAMDQNASLYGSRREPMCSPRLNSGLYAAMVEMGDVMGIFCGHDHDNDFAVDHYGIMLAYGRFSGGSTSYNHLRGNGARVIEITEGKRTIHSWIRLASGEKQQDTYFPKDYRH